MAGITDFEAIDDLMILLGIIAVVFGSLYVGAALIALGFLIMVAKGEVFGGKPLKPQDEEGYRKMDTGTDDDFEAGAEEDDSDGDSDDGGDADDGGDGDADGDGDDGGDD